MTAEQRSELRYLARVPCYWLYLGALLAMGFRL
jgi:hypothetical protein